MIKEENIVLIRCHLDSRQTNDLIVQGPFNTGIFLLIVRSQQYNVIDNESIRRHRQTHANTIITISIISPLPHHYLRYNNNNKQQ